MKHVAKDPESTIIHESANLWVNEALEILLIGSTCSVVVGKAKTIEQAKRCVRRLEMYVGNLRKLYSLYN